MTKFMTTVSIALAFNVIPTAFVSTSVYGQTAQRITAKLICGPHSANPQQLRAFQTNMIFGLSGNQLTGSRSNNNNGGTHEDYLGTIGPTGLILVTGTGENKNGAAWSSEFRGQRNELKDTELKGRLVSTSGAVGGRDCSLIFFKPRNL